MTEWTQMQDLHVTSTNTAANLFQNIGNVIFVKCMVLSQDTSQLRQVFRQGKEAVQDLVASRRNESGFLYIFGFASLV